MALRWDDIDFQTGKLHVRRAKGGTASVHPIGGRELRALRRLKREAPASIYVFVSVSAWLPSALPAISAWSRGLARPRASPSSFTVTCCGIPAATSSQTTARTPGQSSTTSDTSRLIRRCATRHWRLIGLRGSGRTRSSHYPACREMEPAMSLLNAGVLAPIVTGSKNKSGH